MVRGFAAVLVVSTLTASETYPVPRFTDPARHRKLRQAFPEIDNIMRSFMQERHAPGLVYGIVIDGELAHVNAFGVRDRSTGAPVTPDTVFRIASMTKSFTGLAILKLRDEGKLSLDDPVSKWVPEIAEIVHPTRDTGPIRIRQLLTHGTGFPEDNPWGDQQLAAPDATLDDWLRKGVPFSTVPDTTYEYSNYGFALAGRVIANVAKRPYREYVETEILAPLGMTASTLEPSAVPSNKRAIGYRRLRDESYHEEPSLADGAFGPMGGMLTSARDLAKYVAFMLSAWPPRDDPEGGPVRRSSLREMQRGWRTVDFTVERTGPHEFAQARAGAYGYGLVVSRDCRFRHIVGHGGGLPGFGSYMLWLPDYGVGLFAMANITYAGPAPALNSVLNALAKTGGLQPRQVPVAPVLAATRAALLRLWNNWTDREAQALAADNLFKDVPQEDRRTEVEELKTRVGECRSAGDVVAENWLRGTFRLHCEKGDVDVAFTLAPTQPPLVQHLRFTAALHLSETMRKIARDLSADVPASVGTCRPGRVAASDGKTNATIELECEAGRFLLQMELDADGKLKHSHVQRAPGNACGI